MVSNSHLFPIVAHRGLACFGLWFLLGTVFEWLATLFPFVYFLPFSWQHAWLISLIEDSQPSMSLPLGNQAYEQLDYVRDADT